jgi:uncharacterized phage protein gp47/JayE
MSVDFPEWPGVNATDLDVTDPADLVDLALARGEELLPEWQPREGNVEVVLLEQFAVVVAALAARLETVVPLVSEQIIAMTGFARDDGEPAQVTCEFTMSDTLGHTLDIGTRLLVGEATATLAEPVTVAATESTATGLVTLDEAGVVEGLGVDTPVVLIDAVPYVESVEVTAVASPGRFPEPQDLFFARAAGWLASMTQLLARPEQVAWRALTDTRVGRAIGVQRWDGESLTPGDDAGWVTLLALDPEGGELSVEDTAEVQAWLAGLMSAEAQLAVQAPVVTTVNVAVTVTLLPGWSSGVVGTAVTDAIGAYLNAVTWPWGEALRLSRLVEVVERVSGVDEATATLPAADVEIDPYELLTAGTITVTVA